MRVWSELPPIAQLNPAARPIDSLRRVSTEGRTYLRFTNELQVVFFGEAPDPAYDTPMSPIGPIGAKSPSKRQVSRLTLLATETEIRPNGTLVNPLDVVSGEYWGFQKIGEFLPLDYAPPVAAVPTTTSATQAKAK